MQYYMFCKVMHGIFCTGLEECFWPKYSQKEGRGEGALRVQCFGDFWERKNILAYSDLSLKYAAFF
jgi:hypothetical protein